MSAHKVDPEKMAFARDKNMFQDGLEKARLHEWVLMFQAHWSHL